MAELRKPLYPREQAAPPMTICVTGATGFIASTLVRRLLAVGHTVHAVDIGIAMHRMTTLGTAPGGMERLKAFQASLDEPGSYDKAVAGCDCVIHMASPLMFAKAGQVLSAADLEKSASLTIVHERMMVIEPAVRLTEEVLWAANRTLTVTKVVMTSSIAAVVGESYDSRGAGHLFTEADWGEFGPDESRVPYNRSKTLAERRAHEIAGAQQRWTLVTILPGVVQGPPPVKMGGESIGIMANILSGAFWPCVPAHGLPVVDVEDVVAAHSLAAVSPKAKGRYLVVAENLMLLEYIKLLRPRFSAYWLPLFEAPYWFFVLLSYLIGKPPRDVLRAMMGRASFDTSRAVADLGLEFIPAARTANDMAAQLIRLGIVSEVGGSTQKAVKKQD